jgi:hypothetical protein
MPVSKKKALELIDEKIKQFQHILDTATYNTIKNTEYYEAYHGTKALLTELYSEVEGKKFCFDFSGFYGTIRLEDYKEHLSKCISQLKVYKERIQNFWEEPQTIESEKINGFKENNKPSGKTTINIINNPQAHAEANANSKAEQNIDVKVDINIDLKIDLPLIRKEFDNLKGELENLNPRLDSEMDKIQDSLDELSTNSDKEKVVKPFNKLYRFLDTLSDPNSDYDKIITGTQKSIELAQKVGRTYNKFAQWLAMPQVPDLFLGK